MKSSYCKRPQGYTPSLSGKLSMTKVNSSECYNILLGRRSALLCLHQKTLGSGLRHQCCLSPSYPLLPLESHAAFPRLFPGEAPGGKSLVGMDRLLASNARDGDAALAARGGTAVTGNRVYMYESPNTVECSISIRES